MTEETLGYYLAVGRAVSVYAKRTALHGYNAHAVAYGAVGPLNVAHAAIRIETIRFFERERVFLAETAERECSAARTCPVCAVGPARTLCFKCGTACIATA